MTASTPAVIVYSKPACVQCDATYRKLDRLGLKYRAIDITQDAAALEEARSLGYLAAPVVVAAGEHWSGYNPTKLERAAARIAAAGSPVAAAA